jgi:hypothetical protein
LRLSRHQDYEVDGSICVFTKAQHAAAGGEVIAELGTVRHKVKRAERAAVEALGREGVATVHEAMGASGS